MQFAPLKQRKVSPAVFAGCIFALYCLVTLFSPPLSERGMFLNVLKFKHDILERVKSPKIVLVGGSNLAYGVNSHELKRAFRKKVVNMGFNGNISFGYKLEEVKDSLKAGDTVILCPEYFVMQENPHTNCFWLHLPVAVPHAEKWVLRSYLNSPIPLLTFLVDVRDLLQYKWGFRRDEGGKFLTDQADLIFGKLPEVEKTRREQPKGLGCGKISGYGDFLGHLNCPPAAPPVGIAEWRRVDEQFLEAINKFAVFAKANGISVVMVPPPFRRSLYPRVGESLISFYATCRNRIAIPVIGDPVDYIFDDSMFFEGFYHLDATGRDARTARLIRDLRATPQLSEALNCDRRAF